VFVWCQQDPAPNARLATDDEVAVMARQTDVSLETYAAREEQTKLLLVQAATTRCPEQQHRLQERAADLNQPMALGVARRYHGRGVDDDDIDQVALLGLWKAVLGYSPSPDSTFAAYAIPTISGVVKRHVRDHGWLMRRTRTVQEHTLALNSATSELRHDLGQEPDDEDVATHLGVTVTELDRARQALRGYHGQSLDSPVRGTTQTLADTVPDTNDAFALVDTAITLRHAIARLPSRDRRLLRLRYSQGLTQSDIGDRLGISQMHVSRLLRRIQTTLQDSLTLQAS
jgi:RNA polymerase sigma-B factor